MSFKHMVVRVVLLAEMAVFMYMYVFGKNGLQLLSVQKKQLHNLQATIESLEQDIMTIEQEIKDWQTYDFHKEKVAREQLQMARKGDKLFYIG